MKLSLVTYTDNGHCLQCLTRLHHCGELSQVNSVNKGFEK